VRKYSSIVMAAAVIGTLGVSTAEARDQINIVGSSTVYPFSSYVAEAFGQEGNFKTPVIESTGSGGGMKLFCAGAGLDTPDFTNASRRMKAKEFKKCQKNGVTDIVEFKIGLDGLALAQSKSAPALNLSRENVLLAVAAEVPNKDGSGLMENPYHFWDEIDSSLPHRKILFYGPPTSSGTRDAFEDLGMKHLTKHMDVYTKLYKADKKANKAYKKYHKIRQDGVYVPSGENDNLIVQKLAKDAGAIGIFGYSYLEENEDKIAAVKIAGVAPSPDAVQNGSYPYSRSLYFYLKKAHLAQVPGMKEYAGLFLSEKMIGDEGECTDIGLIAHPKALRDHFRASLADLTNMTEADFAKK